MKKKIPLLLIFLRLFFGLLILLLSFAFSKKYIILIVVLVITGFLADIFDGIIARLTGSSTSSLRVLDANVDRIFWLSVLFSCYKLYPGYMAEKTFLLIQVLSLEFLIYLVSLIRFGKTPSPHNLLTKLWGILIAISLTEILLSGTSVTFNFMILIGFVSRTDSLLIYCILKKWNHDIPSFYQAIQLNAGKPIKRYKLFNG